ncbi:hypothetical protein CPAR01_16163 [Colletotrichum paranaense]|uniref:DUF4124 domain-containing protein n=4 Tax=Colletotrichum acutatum species complex TaxID=2707335 RepID=A0A9Q0B4L7_9PEZI|nr:uncharacterized protein CCOS01_11038 [Colletotrichum costaricense]XP_060340889.1 uncharacterized protein CPAR01_16163 [Colletotrichum paranaense]XP_060405059.1 uncharacterized protein CABS01_05427 [Colletotrichum abscissum]KAK0381664.1 hypothetical protein CLIM01_01030 [Colletotrichum limetticola]KAI3554840.1 hypothetical protein CABS02_05015 [Colletotrichum abscissum]KAK1517299.1 hypothetical protein CPAR01_16163 [Colletotrichum paranaense]KAK1519387.1 hypothetical protein CCOS01_11038 [C
MKTQHITLPTIQIAAAAFFAASAEAKVYCTDTGGKVVAQASCDGAQPANTFFLAEHEGDDLQLGDVIAEDKVDASHSAVAARDLDALEVEAEDEAERVSGGFGRRSPQRQCDPSLGHCVVSGVGKGGNNGGGSNGS